MILTSQQTDFLLNGQPSYKCELATISFSYKFFKEHTSPLGNILCFELPVDIGAFKFDSALVLCGELLNVSGFGGVCFQRLYSAVLGSMLSELTNQQCFVDEGCLFVDNKQANLTLNNKGKEHCSFHMIFPIKSVDTTLHTLDLDCEKMHSFKHQSVECFNKLLNDIFIQTQRDYL